METLALDPTQWFTLLVALSIVVFSHGFRVGFQS